MYNSNHNSQHHHHQRHSNSSSSTRHLSPASPIASSVDHISSSARSKRSIVSSDDDDENEDCRSKRSATGNRQTMTNKRRRNKTHHTTSNSDVGNSASEDSALEARSLVTTQQRHTNFDDDDDSEDDDDEDYSENDSEVSDSAKIRRRKANKKVDKVKSDKNKNVTLRRLFVINKSEGGKGGAKKQGQVMIIDHSEDAASLFYQQQQSQAVALAASKEVNNTLMPSPSAASIASITTPTKAISASGVSPKTDKLVHGNSTYTQKLTNTYRTSPLGQSNRVQPSPTSADLSSFEYNLPRILPPNPSGRLRGTRIMCHISLARLTRIPSRSRDSYHSKSKQRNHSDLVKSPNLDSRRNLPPPPAPHDATAFDSSRVAPQHRPSPSAPADRQIANTVIHNSLASIRNSPNDKSLSTAAATANHLKQIKQEGLKTEFCSNDQLPLHMNNSSNKSPSVARRTPQQTPGAMKQFDMMSSNLLNNAGKMVSPLGKPQGVGFKREPLGIKTEYLKVPSNDDPHARTDKDLANAELCLGANEYEPGQRRKRACSVNSSPYKDKKRKKV